MDPTWLVAGQHNDIEARWVADGLRARTDQPVKWVTDAALVHDCRWELRVGADGATSRLRLGDGTVLDPSTVDGVVNRLCWLGAEAFTGASADDREYATAELFALGLGWLESLGGRVVNRPAGTGLAGPARRTAEWRSLARTVRLPVEPYDSDDPPSEVPPYGDAAGVVSVLVVDGDVIRAPGAPGDDLPLAVRDGLVALQRVSGLDLLEAHLVDRAAISTAARADDDGFALRSVSFLATMSRFGDAGLDALHKALIARRGGGR
jgi:hypothetical protein